LIVLWDVSEGQILFVGGGKDLQLKDDSKNEADPNIPKDTSHHHLEEKEITALSWASSKGSILAVGYLDGDILFWKTSTTSSTRGQKNESTNSNIVKLQLSSAEKRLPIIVLHWSTSDRPSNDGDGRLFIYGGDEIGSEEVLTVSYFSS
jgi:syntaxin-binding protein 5